MGKNKESVLRLTAWREPRFGRPRSIVMMSAEPRHRTRPRESEKSLFYGTAEKKAENRAKQIDMYSCIIFIYSFSAPVSPVRDSSKTDQQYLNGRDDWTTGKGE